MHRCVRDREPWVAELQPTFLHDDVELLKSAAVHLAMIIQYTEITPYQAGWFRNVYVEPNEKVHSKPSERGRASCHNSSRGNGGGNERACLGEGIPNGPKPSLSRSLRMARRDSAKASTYGIESPYRALSGKFLLHPTTAGIPALPSASARTPA